MIKKKEISLGDIPEDFKLSNKQRQEVEIAQEDEIILIWDEVRDGSAEITVEPDPENPDTSQIMLNGKLVASVLNGAGLSAGQISLVAPES